jgi:hypothetical protein
MIFWDFFGLNFFLEFFQFTLFWGIFFTLFAASLMLSLIMLPSELLMWVFCNLSEFHNAQNVRLTCTLLRSLIPDVKQFLHQAGYKLPKSIRLLQGPSTSKNCMSILKFCSDGTIRKIRITKTERKRLRFFREAYVRRMRAAQNEFLNDFGWQRVLLTM